MLFFETRKFMSAFTSICRHNLAWARCVQCTPSQTTYIRSFLMLRIHSFLHILSGLFFTNFSMKTLYAFFKLFWESGVSLLYHPNIIWREEQIINEDFIEMLRNIRCSVNFKWEHQTLKIIVIFLRKIAISLTQCSHFLISILKLVIESLLGYWEENRDICDFWRFWKTMQICERQGCILCLCHWRKHSHWWILPRPCIILAHRTYAFTPNVTSTHYRPSTGREVMTIYRLHIDNIAAFVFTIF